MSSMGGTKILSTPNGHTEQLASPSPALGVSPIRVIPKQNNLNKWYLIAYLPAPEGSSVNEGIDCTLCSLKYMYSSVDHEVDSIRQLGVGILVAKLDLREA